jgi:hypothetical protein
MIVKPIDGEINTKEKKSLSSDAIQEDSCLWLGLSQRYR